MKAYYNEIDPYAAQWLRNLIAAGHLPAGDVDERSICDVQPDDLVGYRQCHFFAGIGGWALACRLSGWPDDREIWTGSPPCQPFSVAGKQRGHDDERHLWPELFRLLSARRPAVLMGEQVAAAVGKDWLDGVCADLEGIGYSSGAVVVPACAVNAPHRRDRLWFVGNPEREGLEGFAGDGAGRCGRQESHRPVAPAGSGGDVADGNSGRLAQQQERDGDPERQGARNAWHGAGWIIGHDGKARRVEPGIRLLADGVPARVGKLRAYGNAIVPALAAEVIGAYMESAA